MTVAMHPPSTAAAESRRLEPIFKGLSPAGRRMLLAIGDLGEAEWYDAAQLVKTKYRAYCAGTFRTIATLVRLGLVEQFEGMPREIVVSVFNRPLMYRLTKDGKLIEPLARRWSH